MTGARYRSFEQEEVERLRDLLPASLRPLLQVRPAVLPSRASVGPSTGSSVLKLRRKTPWDPNGIIEIDFGRWPSIPQPQRDLLFLREAGWFDCRNWLQPGPYQIVTLIGSLSFVGELATHNAFAALLAGGVTWLSARQIWQQMNGETVQLDADEFALKRAQFRGYDRRTAARHLLSALETIQNLDRTDIVATMRLQRLQAIAQDRSGTESRTGETTRGR